MPKIIIKVFPDYCSTGLWIGYTDEDRKNGCPNGCGSIEPDELGVSEGLQLALKYWHEIWEGFSSFDDDGNCIQHYSDFYIDRWKEDGRSLAKLMSAENDKYEFIYRED